MANCSVNADQLEKASAILGDTIVDPSMWPAAMETICRAVGATGAMLLQSDARTFDVPRTLSVDEALKHYFQASFHLTDIRAERGVPLVLKGSPVVIDQDFITAEEMRSDPMYNENLFAFGFQWFAGVGFSAGSALWCLSIQRTVAEGPFGNPDKRVLAALSQRLTEVATLSTAVGRIALSSASNALNAVRQAAIAIDRFGIVLDANKAAQVLFDDHIHIKNRRLFMDDRRARSCLEQLLGRLRITPDTAAFPCEPIVIRRDRKGPVVVRVLPIHGAARTPFLGARAMLTIAVIEPKSGPGAALLSKAFGLTPAEAKLASIVSEGTSPERAAEQLGISRETARSQLKAVFAKTATHRQSELVALLSRL
jgi:DNA-binding CsgD family transcriptional regulator